MRDEDEDNPHGVALYGITGALGREVQAALEVDHEGIATLRPVAGVRSAGQVVRWRGAQVAVASAADVTPSDVDFAIFATPPDVVSREAPRLLDAGARVIDASGVLASAPLPRALTAPAPLAWPGLTTFTKIDLESATALALPSAAASTLAPLLDALTFSRPGAPAPLPRLESVTATILMPASHAGREGIEALSRQTVGTLNYQPALSPRPFPAVLAFNAVVPATEDAVLVEAHTGRDLRALLPALGDVAFELTPIWIAAFSGIVASLNLRFLADPDPATVMALVNAHPDLTLGGEAGARAAAEADAEADREAGDDAPEADDDLDADDARDIRDLDDPAAMSLRAALDSMPVNVGTPLYGPRTLRVVLMADPIHRTAQAASTLLRRWMEVLA